MTDDQLQTAALAAVRAMDADARAAFIAMFEAGEHDKTEAVAQAYAVEGVSRQIRLASAVLEHSSKMDGVVEIVGDMLAA